MPIMGTSDSTVAWKLLRKNKEYHFTALITLANSLLLHHRHLRLRPPSSTCLYRTKDKNQTFSRSLKDMEELGHTSRR